MIRNTVEISSGRQLSIQTGGNQSDSMLMLIHGAGGRGDQWHNQAAAFQDRHLIIVPDLLGHGKSPIPKSGYSFQALANDMAVVFQRYRCRHNILIGHSYGIAFTLWLAGRFTDQVDKIILIGAAPFRKLESNTVWNLPVFILWLMRPLMSRSFVTSAFHPTADPAFVRRERAISDQNSMIMMKKLFQGMQYDGDKDLSQVTVPTLIINGEADKLTTVTAGRELAGHLPRAEFVELKGASHLAMMEKPVEVNTLIENFIDRK